MTSPIAADDVPLSPAVTGAASPPSLTLLQHDAESVAVSSPNFSSQFLSSQIVTTKPAFLALRTKWNELAQLTDPDSVFLRHEWFDAAWRWLELEAELCIYCVYRAETLIGIVPLVIRHITRRRLRLRVLQLLAIPDTQQCDVLAAAADLPNVLRLFVDSLQHQIQWDMLDFRYLPSASQTPVLLGALLSARSLPHALQSGGDNPYVSLDGTWQAFYAERGRRLKKSNNLNANRLKNAGEIELVRYQKSFATPEQCDQVLDTIVGISSRSWKEETGLSLENEGPNRFIRAITQHAIAQGWLSIWLLSLNGQAVAMEYQLAFNGQIHALRGDFDNAFRELSVGSYLHSKLLEQLFEAGNRHYFMGPGDNAYKLRWTEKHIPLSRLTATSKTWRGRLIDLLDRHIRPLAQKIAATIKTKKPEQGQEQE